MHPFDIRVRLHLDIGAHGDFLDADDTDAADILVEIAAGAISLLRIGNRGQRRPSLTPIRQDAVRAAVRGKQGGQSARPAFGREPRGEIGSRVREDAHAHMIEVDTIERRLQLDADIGVEHAAPMIAQVFIAAVGIERGIAEHVIDLGSAERPQRHRVGLTAFAREGGVAGRCHEAFPVLVVDELEVWKTQLEHDAISLAPIDGRHGPLDLAIVQVADFRVGLELKRDIVESKRPHFDGRKCCIGLRKCKLQLIIVAPGKVSRIACTLLAGEPGVANAGPIDE